MTGLEVFYVVVLGVCVTASGFFNGSETALVSVPREGVEQLADTDHRVRRLKALLGEPEAMLSTILVANTFVNILAASVATVLFVGLIGSDWGPWVATAAVTALILVVGEITPKSLATRFPVRFSLAVAPFIWRLERILRPIVRVFVSIARGLFRLFRVGAGRDRRAVTGEDIRAMANLGERTGDIDAAEREIIHALFELGELSVRDVMTPRIDIHSLESPVTIDDVRRAVQETAHSRYPVIKEDMDHLIGILYVKDLLAVSGEPSTSDIHRVLHEPVYVPESKPVLKLLLEMRSDRIGFAVVTDEHGGNEGIVTITDLLSELVGELRDEYDDDELPAVAVGDGHWMVSGRISVEELSEIIGSSLPEGEYTTVGGLVLDRAGRIPAVGEVVTIGAVRLEVARMAGKRVDRVSVSLG
ncbi:MAG TPA: hemolysin family protein [Acidimicrobiia bacterium]